MAGDHEEHGFRLLELPMAEEVHAGDIAHLQIGENEIDGLIQITHRLVGRVSGGDLVAGVGEESLEAVAFAGVILHDEYFVAI